MSSNRAAVAFCLSTLILALTACQSKPSSGEAETPPAEAASQAPPVATGDTSQNALDWPGRYAGVLPCADCEGIETALTLSAEGNYTLSERYLGKPEAARESKGRFGWNTAGNTIRLEGIAEGTRSTQFQVGENRMTQLDMQGAKITGPSAERYVLNKMAADELAGSHWRLIELAGQPVEGNPESHFLKFNAEGRAQAKAGCNSMVGQYQSAGPMRIAFGQMASTMMACMDMSQEKQLAEALAKADSYSINGNILSLNRARTAPLARFERVQ
jgi:copper homeostasis protein (lipoprotein)